MTLARPDLMLDVLSMLAMDDESPWILHHDFITNWEEYGYGDLEVSEVLETLDEIERHGWAIPWMPTHDAARHGSPTPAYREMARTDYEQRNHDRRDVPQEYGPWYHLTPAGEAEFRRLEKASP